MAGFLCQEIRPAAALDDAADRCILTYDERFLRRKVITTVSGRKVLIDLPHTTSLNDGDGLIVANMVIGIVAAPEDLFAVTGLNLVQLAWHIGNRHTPCQIAANQLLIQADPVIGHMLEHLGATVVPIVAPFTPEGGAYGHGRTHAHAHGATAHDH
ncbi:MAG: urease accessory protein [Yoonia sp.]|jgi:urease accessory protein